MVHFSIADIQGCLLATCFDTPSPGLPPRDHHRLPISKAYSLYDQLSTPQGLSESDAKEFLEEGVSLLGKILPSIKLRKTLEESAENKYSDIDTLVYTNKLNLHAPNINKVINGSLKTTGGYIFKQEKEIYKANESTWEEIKKQNKLKKVIKRKFYKVS